MRGTNIKGQPASRLGAIAISVISLISIASCSKPIGQQETAVNAAPAAELNAEEAVLFNILDRQRSVCAQRAEDVAYAWKIGIETPIGGPAAVETYSQSEDGVANLATVNLLRKRADPLLVEIARSPVSALKTALVDFAAQTSALCAAAEDPSGHSLVEYNALRSRSKEALEESAARVRILLAGVSAPATMVEELNEAVVAAIKAARAQ